MEIVKDFEDLEKVEEIENLPSYVGSFSLHNNVFIRLKIKSIIFCDYIEICFSGGKKEYITFCAEYTWPMSLVLISYDYNYNSAELYISDCFYKNGFDFKTMDEDDEVMFRFKMESEK